MLKIGLIREGKIPPDNRVSLTPLQCKWIQKNMPIEIKVQNSETRCFKDREYTNAGIEVLENLNDCDILMGIKEVPVDMLIPGKRYFFFSHTKKMQRYNQKLLRSKKTFDQATLKMLHDSLRLFRMLRLLPDEKQHSFD